MEEEFESSISIKEIFFYFLRKWFILLLVFIIGASAFYGVTKLMQRFTKDSYQADASFCTFEDFIEIPSISAEILQNQSINSIYNDIASRTMSELNTNKLKDQFVKSEDAIKAFRIVYNKSDAETDFSYEFKRYFSFIQSSRTFKVTISGSFVSEEQKAAAKELLNIYMATAKKDVIPGYITINEAIPDYEGQSKVLQRSFIIDLLYSAAVGLVSALVVVFLVYLFDPGIKSLTKIKQRTRDIIGISKNGKIDVNSARYLSAKMLNEKTLFVCSLNNSVSAEAGAEMIVDELAKSGLKILYIDFTDTGKEAVSISEYLSGKNISPEKRIGCSYFGAKDSSDWFLLMSKGERFNELIDSYDKVVINSSDCADGSSIAIEKFSDKILFMINRAKDRSKDVIHVLNDIEFAKDKIIGSFIC